MIVGEDCFLAETEAILEKLESPLFFEDDDPSSVVLVSQSVPLFLEVASSLLMHLQLP